MLSVKSILRYLEFKAHKEMLFKFVLCQFFFCLHLCYPFDEIILFLKKSMYFPVILGNSHDF